MSHVFETPYIIISTVINSHMSPMYIETLYIIIRVINRHMGTTHIEAPIIIISRVINSQMGPMYIETPYINNLHTVIISSLPI